MMLKLSTSDAKTLGKRRSPNLGAWLGFRASQGFESLRRPLEVLVGIIFGVCFCGVERGRASRSLE